VDCAFYVLVFVNELMNENASAAAELPSVSEPAMQGVAANQWALINFLARNSGLFCNILLSGKHNTYFWIHIIGGTTDSICCLLHGRGQNLTFGHCASDRVTSSVGGWRLQDTRALHSTNSLVGEQGLCPTQRFTELLLVYPRAAVAVIAVVGSI